MSSAIEIGNAGEQAAVDWLRSEGYLIRDRNWRWGHYEIDIVAERDFSLHFVEVKTRKADSLTAPEEAMTRRKVTFLSRAANQYISVFGLDCDAQIDLIAVDMMFDGTMQVRFIPDAANIHW